MSQNHSEKRIDDLENIVKGTWHNKGISGDIDEIKAELDRSDKRFNRIEIGLSVNTALITISIILTIAQVFVR